MIKEKAVELVTALRSGKYKQSQGHLRTDKGFCCLGVACDISGVSSWEKAKPTDYYYMYVENTGIMPAPVMEYFGFRDAGGRPALTENDEFWTEKSLWAKNDNGVPFEKIADYIEKNWADL